MSDNRPSVYFENDGQLMVIRASAIGHPCMWELTAYGQGIDAGSVPANIKRAYQEGHDAEPLIIERLKTEHSFLFLSAQEQEELTITPNIIIRYHPDGLAEVPSMFLKFVLQLDQQEVLRLIQKYAGQFVVEIKNLSHDVYERAAKHGVEKTFEEYPWQLSVMQYKTGLPGLWVVRDKGYPPDRETGVKPHCDGENRLFFQYVPVPLVSYDDIMFKAIRIYEEVHGEDLITSDRQCDAPGHFPCRFLAVRPEPENGGKVAVQGSDHVAVVPADMEEEVDSRIEQFLYYKGQQEEAKARQDAIRDELTALGVDIAGDEVKALKTSKWNVPIRPTTSTKIHWDKMSPELKAAIAKYRETKTTGRHIQGTKRTDI